ncbi:MAG: hypothetical protein C0392_07930 [Syntrophus sp. (in: bacteria)]|nr:hypothetical protein [Syntrophus sp. (in: bacteria)]
MRYPEMSNKECIILFVKYPERGKVKTRLAESVGTEHALALYRLFVKDIMATLQEGDYELIIAFSPPHSLESFQGWLGKDHHYIPQKGDDLGERMKNAFKDAFALGLQHVLLIGSDSPDLSGDIIMTAFESLKSNDAVIGPTYDGGYYLIGFRYDTFLPRVFEGIPWSTARVFQDSMDIFESGKYLIRVLPEWRDIDTLDDLKAFFERNKGSNREAFQSLSYVKANPGRS